MAHNQASTNPLDEHTKNLKLSLPKETWFGAYPMYQYQGFWCPVLEPTIAFQTHFQAQETDIILASMPKTGTTWLKSLIYAIANRQCQPPSESSLLKHNSHELVPHLEFRTYVKSKKPDLSGIAVPRLFATHIPFESLAESVKAKARIVYMCRDPMDTFVSSWHFYLQLDKNKCVNRDMIEEYFNKFGEGKVPFGPFVDHVLGYWKESQQRPEKVLFLRFEELKKDIKGNVKRLAEFMDFPFSEEEEKEGVIDEIIGLCSLETMKELEVNKTGKYYVFVDNKYLFRKGEVGDSANYLTPEMVSKFTKEISQKLAGSGLSFEGIN